jgi:Xaa-Pro dipeptidase
MESKRWFPAEEYDARLAAVRRSMAERGLDACLISSPENIYYLTGLDHQGYFAYQLVVVTLEGEPILITRAMERAIVRDQVPHVRHVGYSDGVAPIPAAQRPGADLVLGEPTDEGHVFGLEPWSTSLGVPTARASREPPSVAAAVGATCTALGDVGLAAGALGFEQSSSFLPYRIARGIVEGLPQASWQDSSGLVDEVRMVQSPRELECTRQAARVSDAMILAGIAAAGAGVPKRDVMAAVYDAMFRRGGTYPGFVPLVRSSRTLEHEHGTWDEGRLRQKDVLFLEMAGCVRRYHAPMGRLVFIGRAPAGAERIHAACVEAAERAAAAIGPGVRAGEVYRAWQDAVDRAGLDGYRRHHCGYSVGIGYPPSWSGSGVPQGLRADSDLELRPGMVFHLMSWLLRTGRGDSFLSDTVVVTGSGAELLTRASREVLVRS